MIRRSDRRSEAGETAGADAPSADRVHVIQATKPPCVEPPAGPAAALRAFRCDDPHRVLGAHPARDGREWGVVVRAFHPDAVGVEVLLDAGGAAVLFDLGGGLFGAFLPGLDAPLAYRLRFSFENGDVTERGDPYAFAPLLGELDLHLFGEGRHLRLWQRMGAHTTTVDGVQGVHFAVWAPNARRVSVVGAFNLWDGRTHPMRRLDGGVHELFVPDLGAGALYKYELLTREHLPRLKSDPFARAVEGPPGAASRVVAPSRHQWNDGEWMEARAKRDPAREPMLVYEMHLGSWRRGRDGRFLTYREIAAPLVEHLRRFGFTHVEFLPIAEHPFYGSWGYQCTGYYAPTARYGSPDDLRYLVDELHAAGIGVLLDWVPAHFPRDDHALRRFDGTCLFEHPDPGIGEQPQWGTLVFDYGRPQVRGFLVANALYWLHEFHFDGLRVDAVSSMLYLDEGRDPAQARRNPRGGRENLDAVAFLRQLTQAVAVDAPGAILVAEEATAWPGVTDAVDRGGLGFTFKWNMGWMHDTLRYLALPPEARSSQHDLLTFGMLYERDERYLMPLSHDEVVYGKGSLYRRMDGDPWRKFANLRCLFAFQYTRPGKALWFMGSELATENEWDHERDLEWHLADDPPRAAFAHWLVELGRVYREHPCLWRSDHDDAGFRWIDVGDRGQNVVSYVRTDTSGEDRRVVLVVLNYSTVPLGDYRIGVPHRGRWRLLLDSDEARFGGSAWSKRREGESEDLAWHGQAASIVLDLPPLAALLLVADTRGDGKSG